MKKKNLVVANWKMNPETTEEAKEIVISVKRVMAKLKRVEVVITASFAHLAPVSKLLQKNKKIMLGAQNAHHRNLGAYTGEVSPSQLKNLGVKFVMVGHSERRAMGEENELINLKL